MIKLEFNDTLNLYICEPEIHITIHNIKLSLKWLSTELSTLSTGSPPEVFLKSAY